MKKYAFLFVAFIFINSSCNEGYETNHVYSVAIINKISDIIIGEQYKFIAAHYPFESEEFDVYFWQSSDNEIATIDQNGLLKAVGEGEVTIKLYADVTIRNSMTTVSDKVTIHVTPLGVESIRLNMSRLDIANGSTATLTVSAVPSSAKLDEIEWTSSNDQVASVANGVVTAKSIGNAIITAQVKGTNIKAECSVNVSPYVVTNMQFKTREVKMEVGHTFATELIIDPDNAEDKRVTYSSDNPAIASVSSTGVITAVSAGAGPGSGRATITATSVASGVKATCDVEVVFVAELVTVTIEKQFVIATSIGLSGLIRATLHNNTSKPIHIVRFRILDRNNNFRISILINQSLAPYSSYRYPVSNDDAWIRFQEELAPTAVFVYELDGKEYRSTCEITP